MKMEPQHNADHEEVPEDAEWEKDFADVIDPLRRLGERIDRARFPGPAWPVRRPRGQGKTFRLLITFAAAAAVLLAVATAYRLGLRAGRAARPEAPQETAVAASVGDANEPSPAASVGIRVDPSIASYVTWSVPSISMPSTVDANGLHLGWGVPALSFPSFETGAMPPKPKATSRPKST